MAITDEQINTTQKFKRTALVDLPVKEPKVLGRMTPNPFTGLPLRPGYNAEHHIVEVAPATVADATQDVDA